MKVKIKFTDQALGFDPENNCYINALRKRYDVEFSDEPDIVFYSVFGTDFMKYPNSVRIFLGNEPVIPNFNDCDYALGGVDLSFGERYLQQPPLTGYGETLYWKDFPGRAVSKICDRAFCNFVYSNASNGSGAELRVEFCKKLMEYKRVDCPGRVLNNMENAIDARYTGRAMASAKDFNTNWAASKLSFLKNYKFTIAFENISIPGWTTEKLIHPFMAGSIPIYWGNPTVVKYFNPEAFINCNDYGNDFDAVIERIKELDQNDSAYLEMLNRPVFAPSFPFDWEETLTDFLGGIIENGYKTFEKNPMGYTTMGNNDFAALCANGKYGMKTILKTSFSSILGWAKYKMKK